MTELSSRLTRGCGGTAGRVSRVASLLQRLLRPAFLPQLWGGRRRWFRYFVRVEFKCVLLYLGCDGLTPIAIELDCVLVPIFTKRVIDTIS